MGTLISLTGTAVRVFGTGTQSLETVLDVGEFDELCLECFVVSYEGTGSMTVEVDTAMQTETDAGWVSAGSFSFTAPSNLGILTLTKGNFLRYIRWNITSFTVTTAATFWVEGVGRRYPRP